MGSSYWILTPVVYVGRSEHVATHVLWYVGTAVIVTLAAAAVIWALHHVGRRLTLAPEVLIAIGVGGVIANAAEILARGSVTDFLGIHGPNGGIYSAGDIASNAGISLLPIAAFGLIKPAQGSITGLLTSATAYVVVVLLAIVIPNQLGLAILATFVAIAAAASFAVGKVISRLAAARVATESG